MDTKGGTVSDTQSWELEMETEQPQAETQSDADSASTKDSITEEEFLENYLKFLVKSIAKGRPSSDTIVSYDTTIRLYLSWCRDNEVEPMRARESDIRKYLDSLEKKGGSKSTIALKVAGIRAFYSSAAKLGLIKKNPCRDIEDPRGRRRKAFEEQKPFKFYTVDQMKEVCAIFETEPPLVRWRNTLVICLMGVEGLRNIEIIRLNDNDVDWEEKSIFIRRAKKAEKICPCAETFQVLERYLKERGSNIFPEDGGLIPLLVSLSPRNFKGRMTRNGLRGIVNKALEKSGLKIKGASCHVFRHSCGTNLFRETKDLKTVQQTLRQTAASASIQYTSPQKQIEKRPTASLALGITKKDEDEKKIKGE